MSTDWARSLLHRASAVPPIAPSLDVQPCTPSDADRPDQPDDIALEPISGFTCVIEYDGAERLIACRRFKVRGDKSYVGAICLEGGGYRDFRTDRIAFVIDARTGEVLGKGGYFDRFSVDERREATPSWGLTPSRKATLVAGLNVLAFMAHCDGRWQPLGSEPVERFVCSLWLRREWEGEPPLAEIVAHAQRLSPDGETFFKSIDDYARSTTRSTILVRAVAELIEADGVVCDEEFDWAAEFSSHLRARMRENGI